MQYKRQEAYVPFYSHTYKVPTMCILGTVRTLTKEAEFLPPRSSPVYQERREAHEKLSYQVDLNVPQGWEESW